MDSTLVKVLLIIGLIAVPSFGQLTNTDIGLNYDPVAGLVTSTRIQTGQKQHPTQPMWFYSVKTNVNDNTFQVFKLDLTQTNKLTLISKLEIKAKANASISNVKFISADLSCALVKTDTDKFGAYDFSVAAASAKGTLADAASDTDLDNTDIKSLDSGQMDVSLVGNKCGALKINTDYYAWTGAKYEKATAPAGITPSLSDDLLFAASSDRGLEALTAKAYAKITSPYVSSDDVLADSKVISYFDYGTTYRVLVASKSTTGTLKLKWRVYKVDISKAGGAAGGLVLANAGSSSITPITELTLAGTPTMNVVASPTLSYFFIYGTQDSTTSKFYAVGRWVNWQNYLATVADQTIDTSVGGGFLTSASTLTLSLSDRFLYARSSTDHAGFYLTGSKLTVAFAKTTFSAITNLQKSIINDDHANNFFSVYQTKYVPATGVASVDVLVATPVPSTPAGTVELTPVYDPTAGGKYTSVKVYSPSSPVTSTITWISQLSDSTNNYIQSFSYRNSSTSKTFSSTPFVIGSTAAKIVAVSPSGSCVLVDDGASFVTYTVAGETISRKGSNAKLEGDTPFQVSNDCQVFKTSRGVYRYGTASYAADTIDPADLLTEYAFPEDFSYGVSTSIICKTSTAGCVAETSRSNQIFYTDREIFKNADWLIIFTWDFSSWKLQINYIIGMTSPNTLKMVGEYTKKDVNSGSTPTIQLSSSFSKILIKYQSREMDYHTKYYVLNDGISKAIDLPSPHNLPQLKNFQYSLSDNFLYIRTISPADYPASETYNLISYALIGDSFTVASASQAIDPSLLSSFGYRSAIAIEQQGKSELISLLSNIALKVNTGTTGVTFIRLNKIVKSTMKEVIDKAYPYFAKTDAFFAPIADADPIYTLNSQWGRFLYTAGDGKTLRAAYYDTAYPGYAGKVQYIDSDTKVDGAQIKAASSASDCIITGRFYAASLYIHTLDYAKGSATVDQLSTVTAPATMPTDFVAADKTNFIVFKGCTGFVISETVFNKNSETTATGIAKFIKNDDASALKGEVYDHRGNFIWTSDNKLLLLNPATLKYIDTAIALDSSFYKDAVGGERNLVASSTKNVVILDSSVKNGGNYDYAIQMFFYTGTAWVNVFSLSGTSIGVATKYNIEHSSDFETFGLIKMTATGPKIEVRKIQFGASPVVNIYPTLSEFTGRITRQFFQHYSNNYMYFRSLNTDKSATNAEYFYFIDKDQLKLIVKPSFTRSNFDNVEGQAMVQTLLLTNGTKLFAFSNYIADSKKLWAFRKLDLGILEVNTRTSDTLITGFVSVNKIKTLCNPGCTTCSEADASSCSQCAGGYYLDSDYKCKKIRIAGCKVPSDTDSCSSCFEGFYLITQTTPVKCSRCSDSCLTCKSATECWTCRPGMTLKETACVACIDFCDDCSSPVAPALCTTCSPGYTYNTQTHNCDQCPIAGCIDCTPTTCSKCADGFQLNFNKCLACPSGCKTCVASAGVCIDCIGQLVLSGIKCVQKCKAPCSTCSTPPSTCSDCIGGYTYGDGTCTPNFSCSAAGNCKACPVGYSLESGKCVQCTGGLNCEGCAVGNATLCTSCVKGYYLLATGTADAPVNICTACSVECASCTDASSCTSCKDGFFLTSRSSLKASLCDVCSTQCKTCYGTATNCDVCANGFVREGSVCKDPNAVLFTIGIAKSVSSLTLTECSTFHFHLCKIGKIARNKLKIFGWKAKYSGSLRLLQQTGAVATGQVDSSTQRATADALASAVTPSAKVGGQTVTQAEFTPVSSTVDDSNWKYYRNVAIIVGVVIPVLLIIIFIIFFIGYKKAVWCNDGQSGNDQYKYPTHSIDRIV